MKYIILIILLLMTFIPSYSTDRYQLITDAEYFINIDPGEGKGNAIIVSKGFNVDISIDNIQYSQGDIIFVRVKNEKGIWSAPLGKKLGTNFIKEAKVFKVTYPSPNYRREIEVKASIQNKKLNGLIGSAFSDPMEGDNIKPGDTLLVQFKGTNGIWGPKYEVILAKPDLQLGRPLQLRTENIGTDIPIVRLTWTDNSDAESQFSIERRTLSGAIKAKNDEIQSIWIEIGRTDKNIRQYVDTLLETNKEYEWRIRALGLKEWMHSEYSNTVNFKVVSINVYSNEWVNLLNLSPNPTETHLNISFPDGWLYEKFSIFNLYGQIVYSGEMKGSEMQIDVSMLPIGVYYLVICNERKMFIKN